MEYPLKLNQMKCTVMVLNKLILRGSKALNLLISIIIRSMDLSLILMLTGGDNIHQIRTKRETREVVK